MNSYEKKEEKIGCVPPATAKDCEQCGRDLDELKNQKYSVGSLRRVICKGRTGKLKEYAASEVFNWNQDGPTNWATLTWKRGNLTFVRWLTMCNECYYAPDRTTASQQKELRDNMAQSDITPKTVQKAYKIIQQLLAPAWMGACKANDQQRQYAAKVVLWHWPQASNEPMPADIEKLCKGLVVA